MYAQRTEKSEVSAAALPSRRIGSLARVSPSHRMRRCGIAPPAGVLFFFSEVDCSTTKSGCQHPKIPSSEKLSARFCQNADRFLTPALYHRGDIELWKIIGRRLCDTHTSNERNQEGNGRQGDLRCQAGWYEGPV